MSVKTQSISDLAEVWDDLTPIQQQFMIQRAKGLAGYNKMKVDGVWKGVCMPLRLGSPSNIRKTS